MLRSMCSRNPWSFAALLVLQAAACNPDGATSNTSVGDTSSAASSSGGSSGATPTSGAPTSTSIGDGSTSTSTGEVGGSSGSQGTSDGATTAEGSSGASSSSSGGASSSSTGGTGGSTGGLEPFSSFTCTELTVVELLLKEAISGSFTADGVPIDVLAVMVKGGATDFQVDVAGPVAPDDPYAADVAFWEQDLTAKGWDVNPAGPPAGDRRYVFIPEGAQFVAKFSLFYYRIYDGGGNGQFEFECLKQ